MEQLLRIPVEPYAIDRLYVFWAAEPTSPLILPLPALENWTRVGDEYQTAVNLPGHGAIGIQVYDDFPAHEWHSPLHFQGRTDGLPLPEPGIALALIIGLAWLWVCSRVRRIKGGVPLALQPGSPP